MAAQFDFNAGFDPSALSSITSAQFLQMIQQITPLGNIGGVIWQEGTSLNSTIAQGTGGSPDVTGNPRFARYIWLNTFNAAAAAPTPYYYDASSGNWTSGSIAAGSITNAMINAAAEISVSKLADGAANEVLVTDAAGTGVEWKSVASLLASLNDSVPLTAIDDTAAVGAESFLRRVGSTTVWKTFTETVTSIQAALNGVTPTVLTPGANNTLLGTNASGVVTFDAINNLLANGAIGLALLATGGAGANDILYHNGTSWVKNTPSLRLTNGDSANQGLTTDATGTGVLSEVLHTYTHGLGTTPKLIRVVVIQTTGAEAGFTANVDEVEAGAFGSSSANKLFSISADTTTIYISQRLTAGIELPHKTTGVLTAITEANWKFKVYAWK